MLLCFGFAWPLNIIKSLCSHSAKGKSGLFLLVVIIGYIAGILNKVLYRMDYVLIIYCINLMMVCIDTGLFLHYRRLEHKAEASKGS